MNRQNNSIAFSPERGENTAAGWHGKVELEYRNCGGATKLMRDRVQAPLKVQRPFYPEGNAICHSVILHTAGGIVGGDRLSQDIRLEPNSHAVITTASAAKLYRSEGETATQKISIIVEENAVLEWLPQEMIVFDGAIYRQEMRVELAPGARVLLWEISRFGRSARGETFRRGHWRSHSEIWQTGRPLWIDRQQAIGSAAAIATPNRLAGSPIVATLAWVGEPVTRQLVQQARSLFPEKGGEVGVTRLTDGLLCRYRGDSTAEVRHWFTDIWELLRLSFLHRPSCPPRVWPF